MFDALSSCITPRTPPYISEQCSLIGTLSHTSRTMQLLRHTPHDPASFISLRGNI